ncbi:MAG: response regulator [Lachnospiraceae bacterium]|nr:response regulator [Lachnospiraceae bacterium]
MNTLNLQKSIGILLYQTSVIVKGIEKNLMDAGYRVATMTGDFHSLEDLTKTIDEFIVYLPGDISGDKSKLDTLGKITETVRESGKGLIMIGEKNDHADILRAVPEVRDCLWLDRPVDINTLKEILAKELEGNTDPGEKKRILIVDDDPSYARMVKEWIKDSYKVDIVTAGMQAITFLLKVPEDEKVNLILLDYEMPVVDGPQVFQMLRQESATVDIPVIFLTGVGTREGVSRVLELKPDGYLLKSTSREDILAYLKKTLEK